MNEKILQKEQSFVKVDRELRNCIRHYLFAEHLNQDFEKKCGISLFQWLVLVTIKDSPGIMAQNLAQKLGIHASSLTQSLKRLHKKEWIGILEDPKDARKKQIFILEKGLQKILLVYDEKEWCIEKLASMNNLF